MYIINIFSFSYFLLLLTGECLSHHRDFRKLIDPVVLEINLKLLWSHGVEETDDKELGHENYRYAAYSSIHLWLYGRKKTGRVVLPSCLVMGVHKVYPAPDGSYTGHSERSPVFKRSKKKSKKRSNITS